MKLKKNPIQVVKKDEFEISDLSDKEKKSEEFHAVECLCLGLQMIDEVKIKNNVTGQTDRMISINVQVAIPLSPDKIKGAVITPDGLTRNFQQAVPSAPTLRILIHDDYLVDTYKSQIFDVDSLIDTLNQWNNTDVEANDTK